jgi:hypothetical protein
MEFSHSLGPKLKITESTAHEPETLNVEKSGPFELCANSESVRQFLLNHLEKAVLLDDRSLSMGVCLSERPTARETGFLFRSRVRSP